MTGLEFSTYTTFLAVDRDGTLVGTCNANFEAYRLALKEFGIKDPKNLKDRLHEGQSWAKICSSEFPNLSQSMLSEIGCLKAEIFPNNLHLLDWNYELIKAMTSRSWALISNGSVASSTLILGTQPSLSPVAIIGPNKGLFPKPSPDMYNHLVSNMRIRASEILVLEDSEIGKNAAELAGLEVRMISHRC